MTAVLKIDEIKLLINSSQLIREIKYGFVTGDDFYVLKMASAFYNNPELDLTGVAI